MWLVGGIPTPLKNMSSSMGRMTSHFKMEHNPNVPNHQPGGHYDYVDNQPFFVNQKPLRNMLSIIMNSY